MVDNCFLRTLKVWYVPIYEWGWGQETSNMSSLFTFDGYEMWKRVPDYLYTGRVLFQIVNTGLSWNHRFRSVVVPYCDQQSLRRLNDRWSFFLKSRSRMLFNCLGKTVQEEIDRTYFLNTRCPSGPLKNKHKPINHTKKENWKYVLWKRKRRHDCLRLCLLFHFEYFSSDYCKVHGYVKSVTYVGTMN